MPEGVNEQCVYFWESVNNKQWHKQEKAFFSDPWTDYKRYSGKTDGLTLTTCTYKTERLRIHWLGRITGIIFSQ